MPANDLHLPNEILQHIMYYLDLDPLSFKDQQLLVSLLQVPKQLQRLVEPLQYRSFPGHRHANARFWLKAVLRWPGRAAFVRHVTVHEYVRWRNVFLAGDEDSSGEGYDFYVDVPHNFTHREHALFSTEMFCRSSLPDQQNDAMLKQLIDAAKLTKKSKSRLKQALAASEGQPDGISIDLVMALIVLTCTSLDSIDIELCDGFGSALLTAALLARNASITEMNLHRKGQRDDSEGDAFKMWAIAHVFRARRVERLSIVNVDFGRIWSHGPPARYPRLKHLSLRDCSMIDNALEAFLSGLPGLTSLELRIQRPLKTCGRLLNKYARGLERLVLDVDMKDNRSAPGHGNTVSYTARDKYDMHIGMYGLGNLQRLIRLKELEVPAWALIRTVENMPRLVEDLPWCLQTLTVLPSCPLALELAAWLRGECGRI